jgi:hypothetical protein
VEQFTITFNSPFSKTVNVSVGESYYFTVSGVMNFYYGIPCGQWDAYYRYNNGPPQFSSIIWTNFPSTPCPLAYNPAHFYTCCTFTATDNQLIFGYSDSYYGDNCGSMLISVYHSGSFLNVSLGNDTLICQGTSITLDAGYSGATYLWNNGATTQTIQVSAPGNYSVVVTNPGGCTGTDSVEIAAYTMPAPAIGGVNNLCVNSGYYYYSTEPGMNNYQWSVSPGATIIWGNGTPDLIVTWDQSGAQWVKVNYTNSSGCTTVTPTQYDVTVNPLPGAAGIITGPNTVCAGSNGVTYSTTLISNTATYVWSLPPGASIVSGAGTNSITVDFDVAAQPGSITVYGNNLCGNGTVSPALAINVGALPGLAGQPTGESYVCEGDTGVIYYVSPIFNATTCVWEITGGGTITAGNGSFTIRVKFPMGTTSCDVTVFGANACGAGLISPVKQVTVNPIPETPVIAQNGEMLVSSAPVGNQWFFNGTIIPNATQQTITPTQSGLYSVMATLEGCRSHLSDAYYHIMTGMESHSQVQVSVYPVPNDGRFRITLTGLKNAPTSIAIVNALGVSIYHREALPLSGEFRAEFDLRPIVPGVYTLVIGNSTSRFSRKLVIQ